MVDEAMAKFYVRSRKPGLKPDTALAYLRRSMGHEATDRHRKRPATPTDPSELEPARSDDEIAKLLFDQHNARTVEDLLVSMAKLRDTNGTRVIGVYLRLAEEHGVSPSVRKVAAAAGLSHTAVGDILIRLRKAIEEGGFEGLEDW